MESLLALNTSEEKTDDLLHFDEVIVINEQRLTQTSGKKVLVWIPKGAVQPIWLPPQPQPDSFSLLKREYEELQQQGFHQPFAVVKNLRVKGRGQIANCFVMQNDDVCFTLDSFLVSHQTNETNGAFDDVYLSLENLLQRFASAKMCFLHFSLRNVVMDVSEISQPRAYFRVPNLRAIISEKNYGLPALAYFLMLSCARLQLQVILNESASQKALLFSEHLRTSIQTAANYLQVTNPSVLRAVACVFSNREVQQPFPFVGDSPGRRLIIAFKAKLSAILHQYPNIFVEADFPKVFADTQVQMTLEDLALTHILQKKLFQQKVRRIANSKFNQLFLGNQYLEHNFETVFRVPRQKVCGEIIESNERELHVMTFLANLDLYPWWHADKTQDPQTRLWTIEMQKGVDLLQWWKDLRGDNVSKQVRSSSRKCVELVLQLACHGFACLDIKPQNILVLPSSEVRVIDVDPAHLNFLTESYEEYIALQQQKPGSPKTTCAIMRQWFYACMLILLYLHVAWYKEHSRQSEETTDLGQKQHNIACSSLVLEVLQDPLKSTLESLAHHTPTLYAHVYEMFSQLRRFFPEWLPPDTEVSQNETEERQQEDIFKQKLLSTVFADESWKLPLFQRFCEQVALYARFYFLRGQMPFKAIFELLQPLSSILQRKRGRGQRLSVLFACPSIPDFMKDEINEACRSELMSNQRAV